MVIYKRKEDNDNDSYQVYVRDLSSNGTYINGAMLGKGKTTTIQNCSTIAFASCKNLAFSFVNVLEMTEELTRLPPDMKKKYVLHRDKLGSGAFGKVRRGQRMGEIGKSGSAAIKMIEKPKMSSGFSTNTADIAYEANLMKGLDHCNIVKIFDIFDTDEMLYIVLEFLEGGDMYEYINRNGKILRYRLNDLSSSCSKPCLTCMERKQYIVILNRRTYFSHLVTLTRAMSR